MVNQINLNYLIEPNIQANYQLDLCHGVTGLKMSCWKRVETCCFPHNSEQAF